MRKIPFNSRFGTLAIALVLAFAATRCHKRPDTTTASLMTGLDRVAAGEIHLLDGQRVGVITNQTGITAAGKHIADVFNERPEVTLVALFGPEHGIRGKVEGGEKIDAERDAKTGVPIYSLYGPTRKPTPDMLQGLDALVFDIQDVGTRFYTYISTMSLAMEAAAESGIAFVVLDRPNPIGGHIMEGPVLDPRFKSFVGIQPIALRHGMTVGELAQMFNDEGWLANGVRADLHVVAVKGWQRDMLYDETGLAWIAPSPNMPSVTTALLYPGMGLLEATNFSEGRGTDLPFERVGAPWLDAQAMNARLEAADLPGVAFEIREFTPVDLPGKAMNPKFEGQVCQGIRFKLTNPQEFQSATLGVHLLTGLQAIAPDDFKMKRARMNKMSGREWFFDAIAAGESAANILERIDAEMQAFLKMRKKYLRY